MRTRLILILLFASGGVQAQNSKPALDETLRWMKQTAPSHISGSTLSISYVGCRVQFVARFVDKNYTPHKDTFNLADLDPASVEVTKGDDDIVQFGVETTNEIGAISLEGYPLDIHSSYGEFLWFSSNHYAQRFARAMRHAIILCGGKPSTF